jgi:aspartate/methionine/tyrosine aminotransferase
MTYLFTYLMRWDFDFSDTDVPGLLPVRQTAAEFVNQFYSSPSIGVDLKFDATNVMVTAGAIQAISNVLSMTIDCADDVVVTTLPAYGLYTHQTQLLGGTFAAMPTSAATGFAPTARELDAFFRQFDVPSSSSSSSSDDGGSDSRGVRNRVRAVILCFPNNPTGAMLTREQAIEIADALDAELRRHPEPGFALILDEVYVGICHREFYSILQFASPLLLASTFLVLSASKGLGAMPGARAAWLTCGDPAMLAHLVKIQSAASANASSLAQAGLQGALQAVMRRPELMREVAIYYGQRTAYVVARLNRIGEKFGFASPSDPVARACDATFYVWSNFGGLRCERAPTDVDLVRALRDRYRVALTAAHRCSTGHAAAAVAVAVAAGATAGVAESAQDECDENDDANALTVSEDAWCARVRPRLLASLPGHSDGAGVACVPGSAFLTAADARFVRFSCARARLAELRLAMDVLEIAIGEWLAKGMDA